MKSMIIYETDYGSVRLPDDFPITGIRKNGSPDRRFRNARALQSYMDSLNEGASQLWLNGKSISGLRAMSWASWPKS